MAKKSNKPKCDVAPRRGRVIRNTGSNYIVRTDEGEETACRVKGNFRIKGIRTTNPVAVGDWVMISPNADDCDYITAIEPRRNYIIRRASNLSKESHILASNIDLAVVVASLADPATPLEFIDRFLATAEAYNIKAAVVLNKSDLWDEYDRELAEGMRYLYDSIGYNTIETSTVSGDGIDRLKEMISGKTVLFAGNSGVGKSSLINTLVPDANLRTGKISETHRTGMHTTTFSEMLPLPGGGEIIDIPGVKGFGTIDFQPAEVSHYFPEIFRIGRDCRFDNCLHDGEPGCAVREAVENHLISESRYSSYLSVLEDARLNEGEDKYRKPF